MHKDQEENLEVVCKLPKNTRIISVLKSCNVQKVGIFHQGRQKVKAERAVGNWNESVAGDSRGDAQVPGALPTQMQGSDLHSMGETITTKQEITLFSLFRNLKHISQGLLEIQNKKNSKGNKSHG